MYAITTKSCYFTFTTTTNVNKHVLYELGTSSVLAQLSIFKICYSTYMISDINTTLTMREP